MNARDWALLVSLALLPGCVKKRPAHSDVKYATCSLENIPHTLAAKFKMESDRKVRVCIRAQAAPENLERILSLVKSVVRSAMEKWNSIIVQHPSWPFKDSPLVPVWGESSTCDDQPNAVSLVTFDSRERFLAESPACQKLADPTDCRSHAFLQKRLMYIEPADLMGDAAIAHEMGHLFGLGDTYWERGRLADGQTHPDSLMNGRVARKLISETTGREESWAQISEDDRQGMFSVLDALDCQVQECRPGYLEDRPDSGQAAQRYCVPAPGTETVKVGTTFQGRPDENALFGSHDLSEAVCSISGLLPATLLVRSNGASKVRLAQGSCTSVDGKDVTDVWVPEWMVAEPGTYAMPVPLGKVECPGGFASKPVGDFGARYCSDGANALGPFTAGMVESCMRWGGGSPCFGERWSEALFARLRGTGPCPVGAVVDPVTGYCVEGNDAFGPFPAAFVNLCRADGQAQEVCSGARWSKQYLAEIQKRLRQ